MELKKTLEVSKVVNPIDIPLHGGTLSDFIDTIPDPVYYKGTDGRYVGCNSAYAQLLGKPKERIIGATDFDLFPKRFADKLLQWDLQLLRVRERQVFESSFPSFDGTELRILCHLNLLFSPSGEPAYVVGSIIDVTAERKEEQERSEAMAMAAAAETAVQTIEGMIDPVIILNAAGSVERVNRGYAELFGLERPVMGRHIGTLFVGIGEEEAHRVLKRCVAQGKIRDLEARIVDVHGKELPVLVNISLLRDSQRAIDGFVVAIRDISSLVQATDQLRENERKLDAILNASEDAIMLVDREGVIKAANRALAERYNLAADELTGRNFTDLPDRGLSEIRANFLDTIVNSGKPQRIEYEHSPWVFYNSGFPIFSSQGTVDEIAIFSYDITERKQGERLQRALYSISEAAYFARDTSNLFRIVHKIIGRLLPADHFLLVLQDEESGRLKCPYYSFEGQELPEDQAQAWALAGGMVDSVLRSGRPLLLKSEELAQRYRDVHVPQLPIPKEWLGVPLKNGGGTVIGVLATQIHRSDIYYGEEDRRIITFVSSQIAMAIERKINEETLRSKNALLKGLTDGTILALVKAVEIRDPYTAGHQQRVAQLSQAIARKMGLSEERVEATRIAALLHDVGKIAVPSELLSKPGKLSELEFQLIRQHPVVGYDILRSIQFSFPIAEFILEHHEKINGSGYPAGLKGASINLESRILCVADVVDAIGSHRPYRPSRGIEAALEEIERQAGVLYDRDVAQACLGLFRDDRFTFEKEPVQTIMA